MKKITLLSSLFFLLIAAGIPLSAAPVPAQRALEIGRRILDAQPGTKATGDVKIVWDGETAATKGMQPAFYVVARDGGGWVIVAGDDNVRPVLGFSRDGRFATENMPDNVRSWMERTKLYVRSAEAPSVKVRQLWEDAVATKSYAVVPDAGSEYTASRTVEWDQSGASNALCPIVPGQDGRSVSGCLPLAMAEILTWHGYPSHGTGTLADYQYLESKALNPTTVYGYTLGTTYDWTALKAVATASDYDNLTPGTAVYNNLAQLVYDCGVMLQAEYNTGTYGGTSATDSKVVQAFGEHMSYNKAARVEQAVKYSWETWASMLKAEVQTHPVLYCGTSPGSSGKDASHAYVFDGYATCGGEYVFHVNFGWAGACNGYYFADSQHAYKKDGGYNIDYDFNSGLRALFDFAPDPGGTSGYTQSLSFLPITYDFGYGEKYYYGITLEGDVPISAGGTLQIKIAGLWNDGTTDFTGVVKFGMEFMNGYRTYPYQIDFSSNPLPPGYVAGFEIPYPAPTADELKTMFGVRIIGVYESGSSWKPLVAYADNGTVVDELPFVSVPFIQTKASYTRGEIFPLRIRNYYLAYPDAVWYVTYPSGARATIPQSAMKFDLDQEGIYEIAVKVSPTSERIVTHITVGAASGTPASSVSRPNQAPLQALPSDGVVEVKILDGSIKKVR